MDLIAIDVTDVPEARRARRPRHLARRRDRRRRSRGACRHDRLRGADQPRAALPADLPLLTAFRPVCSCIVLIDLLWFAASFRAAVAALHGQERPPPSSARTAAPSTAAGRASAKSCGEWNTIAEEGAAADRADPRPLGAQGPRVRARAAHRRNPRRPAPALRRARARPRHRRRLRARLGAADGGRSRHRQIDAADPGRRRARADRPPRGLHLGRGGGRAGAAARRTARPRQGAGRACGRNLGRGHHRDAEPGQDAAADRHRLDPDHVDRRGRDPRPARSRRCAARRRR